MISRKQPDITLKQLKENRKDADPSGALIIYKRLKNGKYRKITAGDKL